MNEIKFEKPFEYKVIYIFKIDDEAHRGKVKIGDATVHTDKSIEDLQPNCYELNKASRERIKSYTGTAGIKFDLLHTELAVRTAKDSDTAEVVIKAFRDHDVHNVLKNSNIPPIKIDNTTGKEWFETSTETAIQAIRAVKDGKQNLSGEAIKGFIPIDFRPEQIDAIEQTLKQFKKSNRMLWNAKMRFGKTLSALEVIRRSNEVFEGVEGVKTDRFKKVIIITHRPVVDKGWYEDFSKIFGGGEYNYVYGSKSNGYNVKELLESGNNFVYFASIQDLRGSEQVGGKFDKNSEIYKTNWDLIIVDEAHEGTTTSLGERVIDQITSDITNEFADSDTKVLSLSGTPFNILSDYDENEIYTWDYIMEQERKTQWATEHYGDWNPYDELPQMHIYTYDLGDLIKGDYIALDDKAFNFKEFFRVWTGDVDKDGKALPEGIKPGTFVHEADVKHFLDLMTMEDENSNYPYSTKEYRNLFQHSLWMVPGVNEAKALRALMMEHPVFGSGAFNIVNVAGDGGEEKEYNNALREVQSAIKKTQPGNYTITLSCGRLTTGVTVREWTAVFMLAGSYSTSASSYLQTIFRVQSPCNKNGQIKEHSYVFDFAPDRTLKMVSEGVSRQGGKSKDTDKVRLGKFLNFCPVISMTGSMMRAYDVGQMLRQLQRANIERVALNGFDDVNLYNDELLKLDDLEIQKFNDLRQIIGSSKATQKTNEIDINNQGLTEEEWERTKDLEKKKKKHRELTSEEEAELERRREALKMRNTAISILRGISIRMPLLIYGASGNFDDTLTLDEFVDKIDDSSWNEFMPNGVTKEKFQDFKKYYKEEVFSGAGHKIRNITKSADDLEPTERVKKISELFSHFKNPDKETVLTPWRVVNMHMSDTLGGYDFFDEEHKEIIDEPRFVDQGEATDKTFKKDDAQILEINSKTGLYPLYITYSIYREKCKNVPKDELTFEKKQQIWNKVVNDDVFVICKTPMAKSITRRTLIGYNDAKVNAHYLEDFIGQFQNKQKQLTSRIKNPSYWEKKGKEMDFDAVVGNPPYMLTDSGGASSDTATPLYDKFIEEAKLIQPGFISMIIPSKWMVGGRGLNIFRADMQNDERLMFIKDFEDATACFTGIHIDGGVCYFLWNKNYSGLVDYNYNSLDGYESRTKRSLKNKFSPYIIRDNRIIDIIEKTSGGNRFSSIVSNVKPYGIRGYLFNEPSRYPDSQLSEKPFDGSVKVFGVKGIKGGARRIEGYISPKIIPSDRIETVNKYKLFFTTSYSTNAVIPPATILGDKGTVCTETFLRIGDFDNKIEQMNCDKYIRTSFFRVLLYFGKGTMHVNKNVFSLIPLEDFSEKSDIKWKNDIKSIDEQLFKKYNLRDDEKAFFDSILRYVSKGDKKEEEQ